MALRPLPTSICCVCRVDRPGVLVFDPAEAAPERGVPPGPQVRLYDPSAPLLPWRVEFADRLELAPAECETAREALERYARREEIRRQALAATRARSTRDRQDAAAWRQREARREREARENAARLERALAEAEAAWSRAARERLERDEAHARHRDSTTPDSVLKAVDLREGAGQPRLWAVFDPGANPPAPEAFAFVPDSPDRPFVRVSRARVDRRAPLAPRQGRKLIRQYRAWQAREQQQERLKRLASAFHAAVHEARAVLARPVGNAIPLHRLPLDEADLELALAWCRERDSALYRQVAARLRRDGLAAFRDAFAAVPALRRPKSVHLFTQMVSARLAEVAVRTLYERSDPALRGGRRLIDMSLRQVTGGAPFDLRFDLAYPEPGGRRLDVKNARVRPGENRYTHHYVKRLRRLEDGGAVAIVGAVSEVGELIHLLRRAHGDGRIYVLGETDATRIATLEREYRTETLRLKLTRPDHAGQFYPPWIFEMPAFLVAARRTALDALEDACLACPADAPDTPDVPLPLAIAAGLPLSAARVEGLAAAPLALARMLAARDRERRGSLPHLYLTLLRELFHRLAEPGAPAGDYDPALYRPVLFLGDDETAPLGIPDPLRSIAALLASIAHLLQYGWERLREFRTFEFQRAGVLYAWKEGDPEKRWTLMFTHCWNVGTCRQRHLVVGREALCPACRYLICTACGHCHPECRRGA